MVTLSPLGPFVAFPPRLAVTIAGRPVTLARLALSGRSLLLGPGFFLGRRRRFGRPDRFGPGRALG